MSGPDLLAVVLRVLGFVAVLQAAGVAMFVAAFGRELRASAGVISRLGRNAAIGGVVLTAASHAFEPARMAGAFTGVFDGTLQALMLASDAGAAGAIRLLGLALIIVSFARRERTAGATEAVGVVGATLVAASFALMGHTATHDLRWLLATLLVTHLVIVAFWFGALLPFYLASTRDPIEANAVVIERFSAVALWLVPLIFVAGLAMSIVLLPSLASLTTPYGALLLAKAAGFAALMLLAAANKWRWGPLIGAGRAGAQRAFRRSVAAEWVLVAAVLSVTAVMTALVSPGH